MDPSTTTLVDAQAALAAALARIEAYRIRERLLVAEVSSLRKKVHGTAPASAVEPRKLPAAPPSAPGAPTEVAVPDATTDLLQALSICSPDALSPTPKPPTFTSMGGAPLYVSSLSTSEQVVGLWLPGDQGLEKINCQLILNKDHLDFVQLRVRVKAEDFIGITAVKPSQSKTSLVDLEDDVAPPQPQPHSRYRIYLRGRETQPIEFDASQATRQALHKHTELWLGTDTEVVAAAEGAAGPKPGQVVPPRHLTPTHSMRLLGDPSHILSPDHVSCLASCVPPLERMRDWQLAYSTKVHGISLSTLYRKNHSGQVPTLLVIRDNAGHVFGCYTPEGWRVAPRFYGSGETFVFQLEPARMMWPWQSKAVEKNDFFQYSTLDCLALGGCGHFALHVDQELLQGSSGTCGTFGSPCLSGREDFKVSCLEVWQVAS